MYMITKRSSKKLRSSGALWKVFSLYEYDEAEFVPHTHDSLTTY